MTNIAPIPSDSGNPNPAAPTDEQRRIAALIDAAGVDYQWLYPSASDEGVWQIESCGSVKILTKLLTESGFQNVKGEADSMDGLPYALVRFVPPSPAPAVPANPVNPLHGLTDDELTAAYDRHADAGDAEACQLIEAEINARIKRTAIALLTPTTEFDARNMLTVNLADLDEARNFLASGNTFLALSLVEAISRRVTLCIEAFPQLEADAKPIIHEAGRIVLGIIDAAK